MAIYIAIEGADGSGKSTVAKSTYQLLLEHSNQRDHIEIVSHNAFDLSSSYLARTIGNKTSSVIRYGEQNGSRIATGMGYLLSLVPYLLAKRKGRRKGVIVSDRSPWITGQVYMPKMSRAASNIMLPILKTFMDKPDYVIYLKVDSEVAQERVGGKGSWQLYSSRKDLDDLVARYDAFMGGLSTINSSRFLSINTNSKTLDEVCEESAAFIDKELSARVAHFTQEIGSISDYVPGTERASLTQKMKGAFSVESLKMRLAQWYREGRIDEFDGAEVLNSLNKNTTQYILGNFTFFAVVGISTPSGIGSLISCPVRFFWTIGNRAYWTIKHDRDRAKIHGLDIALISAIPGIGSGAHLISLYRENPKLYELVKEHSLEYIPFFGLLKRKDKK